MRRPIFVVPIALAAAALSTAAFSSTPLARDQPGRAPAANSAPTATPELAPLRSLIDRIVAADYAGDRMALDRLYAEAEQHLAKPRSGAASLAASSDAERPPADPFLESRVRYWRGFAKWRRSMNGANETPTPTDLVSDLDLAVAELRRSGELDPSFVDARIGEMQCLGLILFFDNTRVSDAEQVNRLRALLTELKLSAADNPRYVWAWGMAYFNAPAERGGGPDNVIAAYKKALEGVEGGSATARTPLDPAWGEPELYVNLAYSYLNKPAPDLALARQYVDKAVALVPTWHYARDILSAQIEAAEKKAQAGAGEQP